MFMVEVNVLTLKQLIKNIKYLSKRDIQAQLVEVVRQNEVNTKETKKAFKDIETDVKKINKVLGGIDD